MALSEASCRSELTGGPTIGTLRRHRASQTEFPGADGPVEDPVDNRKIDKKKYQKPEIIHVEKIEARAVTCAKSVGDDFCETNAPTTS